MTKPRIALAAVLCLLAAGSQAQSIDAPFAAPFRLPAVQHGSVDFGDVDRDGDLDIGVVGQAANSVVARFFVASDSSWWLPNSNVEFITKVYRRLFVDAHAVSLGTIRWGDFDGDGDDDFLITGLADYEAGTSRIHEPILEVYENQGVFTGITDTQSMRIRRVSLPGLYRSSADWVDFDGDGDLDFVAAGLPSRTASEPTTRLYLNEGGEFEQADVELPGVYAGALAWADYDGDGDPDLALIGDSGSGIFIGRLLRNDGGRFVDSGLELPGVAFGSLDWADFDRDGDPDLALTGGQLDPRFLRGITHVYRNDGGTMRESGFDFAGHALGEARWGDADLDGDLDLYVVGAPTLLDAPALRLYSFDGANFELTWERTGVRYAAMAVGDYNQDGDADVATSGQLSVGGLQAQFLLNRIQFECIDPAWVPLMQPYGECP